MGIKRKTKSEEPHGLDKKRKKSTERSSNTEHNVESSRSQPLKEKKKLRPQLQSQHTTPETKVSSQQRTLSKKVSKLPFEYKYIVAPMVGASELPFRLLCRKYGAQLVYTPMMLASQFATSEEYRAKEFQTTPFDRPLVCHFAASDPKDFAKAAKLAEPDCDAIDLNLGCPQRTAHVGHYGSYLLDKKDRELVLSIVKAGVKAVNIPIFVKIRLLGTFEETLELVRGLYDAGASLIAVHARYRATFHRKGAGARDGPAILDQVQKLKEAFPDKLLITNGNTIVYDHVVDNLQTTHADGIMCAEGILDNPALYLGRFGSRDDADTKVQVTGGSALAAWPRKEKLVKKLRQIKRLEVKANAGTVLTEKEKKKISQKSEVQSKFQTIDEEVYSKTGNDAPSTATLGDLYKSSDDKVQLALEYLQLARQYPAIMRTVIFHTRRILKKELATYQLMEECLACTSVNAVEQMVLKMQGYQKDPASFQYDVDKAKKEKAALERKKQEEGKRKRYEERMSRKAKREGKDLEHYLRQGAAVPTLETVRELKSLSKEDQLKLWKEREHSQHCVSFHLLGECARGRACAFLHTASQTSNTFNERDEVAG
jgi:tRNA-dihydrouridine synthase 1